MRTTNRLDLLLSPALLEDPQEGQRARLLGALLLGAVVIAGGYAILHAASGGPTGKLILSAAAAALCAVLLASLARGSSTTLAGDGLVAIVLVGVFGSCLVDGGLASTAVVWLPGIPIIASMVGRTLGLLPTAVIVLFGGLGMALATQMGLTGTPRGDETVRTVSFVTAVLYSSGFLWLLDKARREAAEERERMLAAREDWISVVSHELRTPATKIRGAVELLANAEGLPAAEQAKLLEMARKGSERLARLVNDLLQIERLERGTAALALEYVDFGDRVRACAEDLELADPGRTIVVSAEPIRCRMDGDRMDQVVTNLVGNALKFSPPGSTVRLDLTRKGENVRLEVQDEGQGIPEELSASIFERFQQADSSSSRSAEGLGLGLFISRRFVELHGGEIGHSPRPGGGTSFWVELPVGGPESA